MRAARTPHWLCAYAADVSPTAALPSRLVEREFVRVDAGRSAAGGELIDATRRDCGGCQTCAPHRKPVWPGLNGRGKSTLAAYQTRPVKDGRKPSKTIKRNQGQSKTIENSQTHARIRYGGCTHARTPRGRFEQKTNYIYIYKQSKTIKTMRKQLKNN